MWEFVKSASQKDNSSLRRIINCTVASLIVAFLWLFIFIPNTYAVNAVWNENGTVRYDGDTYNGPATATTLKSLNLPEGTKAFTYVDPETSADNNNGPRQIHVIYYEPVNTTGDDTDNTTTAKYKSYTYNGQNSFTNPSSETSVTIDKQSDAPDDSQETSSCKDDSGLGWIICPVTNLLAKVMDFLYGIISGFMEVRPVSTNQESALFRVWSYMRSIANIAFVAAFLIIIYSQLTNYMMDSYSLKKMLPRLIIAALLVNLSYYICAIGVDISNVLGYSINDIFIGARNSLLEPEGYNMDLVNFESISGFVLSGGTMVTAGSIGLATTLSTYSLAGAMYLLLPSLLALLMAVLVAIIVLAARQALVTILIVIAPLAFVAYLLPNTEKWFEKWRETLMAMLILFPAFSVIFGGSQLAGSIIIQNANTINTVILGLLVQIMPLAITPFLMKLSGSLLSKVAGFVNDPNKGIIDRTRKWSQERADVHAAKQLAEPAQKHQVMKRFGQYRDHSRRKRESYKKEYGKMADNRFNASKDNKMFHEFAYNNDTDKNTIEQRLDRDLHTKVQKNSRMYKREMYSRTMTEEATLAKGQIDLRHEELRAGHDTTRLAGSTITHRAQNSFQNVAVSGLAKESAKRVQQTQFETLLAPSAPPGGEPPVTQAALDAASIDGEKGVLRIQAHAKGQSDKRFKEEVDVLTSLMSSRTNTADKIKDSTKWLEEAINNTESIPDSDKVARTFAATDLLLQTGATGKMKLYDLIKTLPADDKRPQVVKLKSYLLPKGINESNIIIDKWACDGTNRSIHDVAKDPKTYERMNPELLAGQPLEVLEQHHKYAKGGISVASAEAVLDNPQASRKLTDDTRPFFEFIAGRKKT